DLRKSIVSARHAELSFDPTRAFSATIAQDRLCVKGAPEVILPRCRSLLQHGERRPLEENGRVVLLKRARRLAARGLRLLMVAEGAKDGSLDNPQELTVLGFIGINDPLRPTVRG